MLLEKESINLPQIMKVLGERPYPLKESIREYLDELEKRQQEEATNAYQDDAAEPDHSAATAEDETLEDPAKDEGKDDSSEKK